jgi:hypothetical protein
LNYVQLIEQKFKPLRFKSAVVRNSFILKSL